MQAIDDWLPMSTLELAKALIERRSVTPVDAGCQPFIESNLSAAGFTASDYSQADVTNTLYSHGHGTPHLLFLGHTDVVPSGPESEWSCPPFIATETQGNLYGRGAADMKGAVAAMLTALAAFVKHHPAHVGRVSLLLTSDEEGLAEHGVRAVLPKLITNRLLPDYCLVGEPSSLHQLGDNIRIGRRGSIHGEIRCYGIQGHTAYADKHDNPIHRFATALQMIADHEFDAGDEHFPATLLHFSNLQAGTGATNVTPGAVSAQFNIRNSPVSSAEALQNQVIGLLEASNCGRYELDWRVSGLPFITTNGALLDGVQNAVKTVTGLSPVCDTGGGTSDGRFFAAKGVEVVELGLVNQTIHQLDEHVRVADLELLHSMYYDICQQLLND